MHSITSSVASKKPRHHLDTVGIKVDYVNFYFVKEKKCCVGFFHLFDFIQLNNIILINLIQSVEYPLLPEVNNFTAGGCCHGYIGLVLKELFLYKHNNLKQ